MPYVAPPSIPLSTVTTKGDLIAATASKVVSRLGVGSDTQVLTADSTQATGVKWAAAGGGGGIAWFGISKASGYYSTGPFALGSPNTMSQDTMWLTPIYAPVAVPLASIGLQVTTAVASTTIRLGIYADNGSGMPGALILDAGTIDSSTTGFKEITISQAVGPGLLWLAGVAHTGAPSTAMHGTDQGGLSTSSSSDIANSSSIPGYTQASVTSTLPANATTTPSASYRAPRILVKAT
jgi:hypothetical protein